MYSIYSTVMILFLCQLSLSLRHPDYYQAAIPKNWTITTATSAIRDNLVADAIIPEVLDDFEPIYYVDVTYSKHEDRVLLGNELKVKNVQQRPTFAIHGIDDATNRLGKTWTLALTDPDAKSRDNPMWSEMCHWIMTNLTTPIPGQSPSFTIDFNDLEQVAGELIEYKPPGPPPKTGPHRYVFVLLEGDAAADIKAPEDRKHWGYRKVRHGVRDWAAENGLRVVGANYFFARNKKQ